MAIRITTLSENTAGRIDLLAEWGLSILVETDSMNVLLDAGRTTSAAHNADRLRVDLNQLDKIVLSHGHADHTGGLRDILLKVRKPIDVIAHPDVWAAKYGHRRNGEDRYVGIPFQRAELEALGANFNLNRQPVVLNEEMMTTGEVPAVTDFEEVDPDLLVKEGAGFRPDAVLDDRALIIKTGQGLVVILGCAHRGIINTLYHAQKLTGIQPIHMVLGGCHLNSAGDERIWRTIAALKELGVEKIGVSHCTGLPAAAIMAHEFGDGFFFNNAGTVIELP